MVLLCSRGLRDSFMRQDITSRKPVRIKELDRNFDLDREGKRLRWIDAFDRRLALRGLGWLKENREQRNFHRLPLRAGKAVPEAVAILGKAPAGVFLSFFTDAPDISVRIRLAQAPHSRPHFALAGSAGAEIYCREGRDWHPAGVALPPPSGTSFQRILIEDAPRQKKEYRVYMPPYEIVEEVTLGFTPGAAVLPAPTPQGMKPILFYGTSITQGGCANTAGSGYVSATGRMLDTEVINLGFSGNGKGEPEVAALIREVDAEIFVLDFLANADADTLPRTLPAFIKTIRQKRQKTPIVIMSCPAFDKTLVSQVAWDNTDRKRDTAMRTYLQFKDAGDENVFFIDGNALLPAGVGGSYVDGIHPTSHGFAILAERLVPQLSAIRLRAKRRKPGSSPSKTRRRHQSL